MERRGEAGGGDIAEGETAGCCAGDAPDADSEAISERGGLSGKRAVLKVK